MSTRSPPTSRTTRLSNDSRRRKPRSGSAEAWVSTGADTGSPATLPSNYPAIPGTTEGEIRNKSKAVHTSTCTPTCQQKGGKKKECWSALTKIGTLFKITKVQITDLRVLFLKLDFMVSQRQSRITLF